MSVMTKLPNVPDSSQAIAGMAYFAGTGPFGKTCGDCVHRGYYRTSVNSNSYRVSKYAMYKQFAGRHGPNVDRHNDACKYFEEKQL